MPANLNQAKEEARIVTEFVRERMFYFLDGKATINTLREQSELDGQNYQWKQTEWVGWYFEFFCQSELIRRAGKFRSGEQIPGTNAKFDLEGEFVWDLKCHTNDSGPDIQLNDRTAIETCIAQKGGVGFIILFGDAIMDESGAFRRWHNRLKRGVQGGMDSPYMLSKPERPPRPRKEAFIPTDIRVLFLDKPAADEVVDPRRNPNGILKITKQGKGHKNPGREKFLLLSKAVTDQGRWLIDESAMI
jgi:hypothetical protein